MVRAQISSEVDSFIDDILTQYTFKTYEDTNVIMVYLPNKGIYVPAEPTITHSICQTSGINTPTYKGIVEMNIRGKTYVARDILNPSVCISNGILRCNGGSVQIDPHSSKHVFENQVNILYNPQAICPIWEKTVETMLPKREDRLLLQEWFGYHFMPGQQFEKAMFFTGKRSTGKSTSIYVLESLLGGSCTHWQLSDLVDDKNYCNASLYGKLANTYTDMGGTTISDCGRFKVLTGSKDTLSARMPYEKPFSFLNGAKLTFASNKLPPLSANVQGDMAFWKRVLMIQFEKTISNPDMSIFSKLDKEISGILNWALEGYKRLYNQNGIFTSNTDDVYSTWRDSAYSKNPLCEFIEENMAYIKDSFILFESFCILFSNWCNINGEAILSKQEIRAYLAQLGVFETYKSNKNLGTRVIYLKGICEK